MGSAHQYRNKCHNLSNPEILDTDPESFKETASAMVKPPPPIYNTSFVKPSNNTNSCAALSSAEKVLNYISGTSTDLSDIPSSLIDQSEVLKHLLMSKANSNINTKPNLQLKSSSQLVNSTKSGIEDANISLSMTYNHELLSTASKLASKSSSSGSVYSNPIDYLTSTSGYSSSSASTPYTQRSTTFNNSNNPALDDLPPPPAYPQWLLNKSVGESLDDNNEAQSNLGRSVTSKENRRDLSLGPELNRAIARSSAQDSSELAIVKGSSLDKSPLSQSQPDLSKFNSNAKNNSKDNRDIRVVNLSLSQRLSEDEMPKFFDLLYKENISLRQKVDNYSRKVAKLQKFEAEILKITAAHESLVQNCSRREQLEKLARTKLQNQLHSASKTCNDLRKELDIIKSGDSNLAAKIDANEQMRLEISKRDAIIAQLLAQNKELMMDRERQEVEISAHKQTILGQRRHIDLLDNALASSQSAAPKVEDEVSSAVS